MCGIVGIKYFDNSQKVCKELLKKSTDIIIHRGPDSEGFFIENNIGLGHRRLSIIDLKTGIQPMIDSETGNAISFNGEIYNYIEIRNELEKLSYKFETNSDTEVILKAYSQWGIKCLKKFNGMWAFAIWDKKRQRLFISRDRLGIKPLHYYFDDEKVIFSSEIKSIFSFGVEKSLNSELFDIYFSLGYIPAPYTFFKNIKKLKPGHFIIVENQKINIEKYWDLPVIDENKLFKNKEFVNNRFNELFTDAVKIRMRTDVPFGAFLSGGLDSTSVVALMAENSNFPIETFTIGFKNPNYDERNLARLVANKVNANYHERVVEPDSFESELEKIAFHYDEPFGDSSAIPTGKISQYASNYVKMVLTGDGGDELLSGYNAYQAEKIINNYRNCPVFIKKYSASVIKSILYLTSGKARNKFNDFARLLETSLLSFEERLLTKAAWLENVKRKQLLRNYNVISVEEYIHETLKSYPYKDSFYKLMAFNLKVSLPDDMLTKVDRMSMASSIEIRVPFLDYRLVEFMCQVDKRIKMEGYERKSILKNTIGKKLPVEVLSSSKKGFSIPLNKWFADNKFSKYFETIINSDFNFDKDVIKKIIDDNNKGIKNNGNLIWMFFVLNKVCEK